MITLAAGLSLLYWIGYVRAPEGVLRSVIKTASVAVLAAAVPFAGGPWLLALALGFCAAGDWFLSRAGERAFLMGVGAFAIGHLVYILLFLQSTDGFIMRVNNAPQIIVITAFLCVGAAVSRLLWRHAGALRFAVLAYVPVILGMGVAALGVPMNGGWPLVIFAALCFVLSDLTLAFEVFILPEASRAARVAPLLVWPLYWLAQLGFFVAFTHAPPFS